MVAILSTTQLTKTYQSNGVQVEALRGVDFELQQGEFVAIMGTSGCGKSTLLHLLGGLDSPTSGEINIAGQRIDQLNETKRAIMRRKEVGFVFQRFNLINNLTVADNIEMPALMAGMSAKKAEAKRQSLLDELGIGDKAQALPTQLSGGQQQRVAIARALMNEPAVLLADEPTGNLDSQSAREVLNLLRRYHTEGQTILLVTHDAKVASMANRVITMRDGQIVEDTDLQEQESVNLALNHLVSLEA